MKHSETLETVLGALPYPDQIHEIDFSDSGAVRFSWRGARYRISAELLVEEVQEAVLATSDRAILLSALLKTSRALKEARAI